MDYDSFSKECSFQNWFKYEPNEIQYIKYAAKNPSIIAAGHKIADVYYAFADAHASFLFAGSDDFGQISGENELSKLYAKSHFLRDALLEYAICLDLSWQVIWAYVQPTSLIYLMKQKYKDMEKECTRESVREQLKCAIAQKGVGYTKLIKLYDIFEKFDADEDVVNLRLVYNSIKHQGTIHIEGLGRNDSQMVISVNDFTPPMLHRKSYTIEQLEEMLLKYNKKFVIYMDNIIGLIMPEDYLAQKTDMVEVINTFNAIQKINK